MLKFWKLGQEMAQEHPDGGVASMVIIPLGEDGEPADEATLRLLARMLRLAVIRGYYEAEFLSLEDAQDLLRGRLDPDDPESAVDDSELLLADEATVARVLGEVEDVDAG